MRAIVAVLAVCLAAPALIASGSRPVDVAERAKGAARIVVARVADVQASFQQNAFGDRIIVSRATLSVEEALKGEPTGSLSVEIEGGSVGDLTLRVSDMPVLEQGDRAVFFLDHGPGANHIPHRRGLGILKLDNDRVSDTSLTLQQLKEIVRGAIK